MLPTYYAGGERPLTPDDISKSEAKITKQIIIKSPTIPTASAEELGKVRMFTGETGAVYTHGYIYECVVDNAEYSWNRVDVQPVTDLSSLENRVTAIEDAMPAMQTTSNLVTSISSSSTNTQYPSAKCVYDIVGNIETLLQGV